MQSLQELLNQGVANAWLFIPMAIVLGALHGLEPGHSKTMMAAFIIAVRGTIAQAVLLGLSAAISHSLDHLGAGGGGFALRLSMERRSDRTLFPARLGHHHPRGGGLDVLAHPPGCGGGSRARSSPSWIAWRRMDRNRKRLRRSELFETNVPPRVRLQFFDKSKTPVAPPEPDVIVLETIATMAHASTLRSPSGRTHLEAKAELPEPHEFEAVLTIRHGEARGDYEFAMEEHHHEGLDVSGEGYQDAHERAHAEDNRPPIHEPARHHGTDRGFSD